MRAARSIGDHPTKVARPSRRVFLKPCQSQKRIRSVLYVVRHRNHGYEAVSPPITAALAVEAAVALAAAGRVVTVTDEMGKPVDFEELSEQVRRAAAG